VRIDIGACRSVLLITNNHVGNILFCTPAIRLLKTRCAQVQFDAVILDPRAGDTLRHNPHVTNVFVAPRIKTPRRRFLRRLARSYELVIDFNNDKERNRTDRITTRVLSKSRAPSHEKHRVEENLEFVQSILDCSLAGVDRRYELNPQPQDFASIEKRLDAGDGEILVGFHLGSRKKGRMAWKAWLGRRAEVPKIWPLEKYIALAQALRRADSRIRPVVTGVRNEGFLGRRFVEEVPGTINLIGRTSLLELAALMRHLAAFVSHDTGAAHVASATDVPLIGLFGPNDPRRSGPYPLQPGHTMIRKESMDEIEPDEVCTAVLASLRQRPSVPRGPAPPAVDPG